jgi:hypothetical protein
MKDLAQLVLVVSVALFTTSSGGVLFKVKPAPELPLLAGNVKNASLTQ